MIDYGTGSIPKFVDIDGDGLTDMFIAHFFAYKPVLSKESRVAYYKNTGTLNSPEFTVIDKDFQNLSSLNVGLRMVPAFGDINGDSKIDMFLGLEDGTLFILKIIQQDHLHFRHQFTIILTIMAI